LVEADSEGVFALLWVKARSKREAKATIKVLVNSDGTTARQFESIIKPQENAAKTGSSKSGRGFGNLAIVIGPCSYEYDDEEMGFDFLDYRAEA